MLGAVSRSEIDGSLRPGTGWKRILSRSDNRVHSTNLRLRNFLLSLDYCKSPSLQHNVEQISRGIQGKYHFSVHVKTIM